MFATDPFDYALLMGVCYAAWTLAWLDHPALFFALQTNTALFYWCLLVAIQFIAGLHLNFSSALSIIISSSFQSTFPVFAIPRTATPQIPPHLSPTAILPSYITLQMKASHISGHLQLHLSIPLRVLMRVFVDEGVYRVCRILCVDGGPVQVDH